ncbi:MscL family protein [Leuconostocaceae bacterium ESL0723]|nr:MscL family protein [Leuconostocaceae bacterium ESL0723]
MAKKHPKIVDDFNKRSHNTYMEFRQFFLGRNFLATAVGVVIGANFFDFVKTFISLFAGIGHFIRIALQPGHPLQWQIITAPLSTFLQSVISLIVVALVLFAIIQIINNVVAERPEEKFGYNYYLAQMQRMQEQQEITNKLLQQILDEKQNTNQKTDS